MLTLEPLSKPIEAALTSHFSNFNNIRINLVCIMIEQTAIGLTKFVYIYRNSRRDSLPCLLYKYDLAIVILVTNPWCATSDIWSHWWTRFVNNFVLVVLGMKEWYAEAVIPVKIKYTHMCTHLHLLWRIHCWIEYRDFLNVSPYFTNLLYTIHIVIKISVYLFRRNCWP